MSLHTDTLSWLGQHTQHEVEYRQALEESFQHIVPIVNANEDYKKHNVLQRLITPDRVLQFKVEWEDDTGACRVNQGYRVQHSNILGPYKGGTRFHPSVNTSVLKFLAYEQSFKNALTGLALGAGKGGADFDPKTASKSEIRRFCKAYMRALQPYIGANSDVPAGDINVSDTELGYMFGEYLKNQKSFDGVLSGKPIQLGGSEYRVQATGSGVIFFTEEVLQSHSSNLEDQTICISGAGNVALHAALKAIEKKAKVKTLSNSRGFLLNEKGISASDIRWLLTEGKNAENALSALADESEAEFIKDQSPWCIDSTIAMPCATQNEIDEQEAKDIVNHGALFVVEGANMPCTQKAVQYFKQHKITFVPGKAANAGGVILSGFEMQQNAAMRYQSEQTLEEELKTAMKNIHEQCVQEGKDSDSDIIDYERGANVAAFRKLANAIVATAY